MPTFAFNLPGAHVEQVATELAARQIAVWHGDYYAVEIMKLLGLEGTAPCARASCTTTRRTRSTGCCPRARRAGMNVVERQSLIRFDTTNPPGNEAACIEFVRGPARGGGCETQTFERAPGRPNLVTGSKAATRRRFCSRATSTSSPRRAGAGRTRRSRAFVDGYVWGRGALDMKGGVAMLVDAFLRAKRENVALPGDLVLVVLADEENGGDQGARFCRRASRALHRDPLRARRVRRHERPDRRQALLSDPGRREADLLAEGDGPRAGRPRGVRTGARPSRASASCCATSTGSGRQCT